MTSRQATSAYAKKAGPAVRRVGAAVKAGLLVKPNECEHCGSCAPVQAHHHNGYDPDHALDVIWLCHPCHTAQHPRSGPKPLWERHPREYQRLTGRLPYAGVQTFGFSSRSTPKFLFKTVRRLWAVLRTEEERAAIVALIHELAQTSRENVA